MALFLNHLLELGAVVVLLLLGLTIGLEIGRRAGVVPTERPARDLLAALLLGLSVYATIVLLLGLAGLLRPWWLATATGGIAAAVARALPDSVRLLRRCSEAADARRDLIAFGVVGAIAAALLIQSSAPPTDWDSLIYHLEVPRAWLADGSVHLPIDNLHAAFTGLMHLLYVPLLAIDAASGAATLEAALGCLLAVTLFEFGDRFFDRDTGRIAAVALFGSPAFVFVAMTPRVDVTVVLFLVAALYFLYASAFPDEVGGEADGRSLAAAAALLGLATSVKLLAAPWIVAVAPLALFALLRRSEGPEDTLRTAGLAFAAFVMGAASGLLLRWHLTGAPLYPALSPRLLEPWLQPWYGGAAVLPPEAVLEQRVSFTRQALSLSALLTDPGSLTPEREGRALFPEPAPAANAAGPAPPEATEGGRARRNRGSLRRPRTGAGDPYEPALPPSSRRAGDSARGARAFVGVRQARALAGRPGDGRRRPRARGGPGRPPFRLPVVGDADLRAPGRGRLRGGVPHGE